MILYGTVQFEEEYLRPGSNPVSSRYPALQSIVMSKIVNGEYYIVTKNKKVVTNILEYKLDKIEKIHCELIEQGTLMFLIKEPTKCTLTFHGDEVQMVKLLINEIKRAINGENVEISEQRMPARKPLHPYDPRCIEHVGDGCLDSRVLNMSNLVKLVLEKCTLSSMPKEVGNLPIQYLSLSGSIIPSTQVKLNLFWMWMSGDTICNTLKVLDLDSINLTSLPFEIFFMDSLSTLSINNNQLTFLPSFIGEMKKLERLYVSNNLLAYFPFSMLDKQFDVLDVSDNKDLSYDPDDIFMPGLMDARDRIIKYRKANNTTNFPLTQNPKKLSVVAFCALFDQKIKIKREDMPLTLCHMYNLVSRCILCYKTVVPDYCILGYVIKASSAKTLFNNRCVSMYTWQTLRCAVCPNINLNHRD